MTTRSTFQFATGIALVLGAAILAAGCFKKDEEATSSTQRVDVHIVATGTLTDTSAFAGEIVPAAVVVLMSEVPGKLERIMVDEGATVSAGQPVAVVDQAVFTVRVKQAEASLAAAQAARDDAEREAQRTEALLKDGAATEQMADRARTALAGAEAGLAQATAGAEMANIEMDKSTLKSPINGTVTAKHIDAGNLVSPGAPILTIQDMSTMKAVFAIPEQMISSVTTGKTRVHLDLDGKKGTTVESTVTFVSPSADRMTRTVKVEAVIADTDGLMPGMFARVTMELARADNVPLVPEMALIKEEEKAFVFVAEGTTAARREIKLGLSGKDVVQATDGLKAGEAVIIRGQQGLKDGAAITVGPENAR